MIAIYGLQSAAGGILTVLYNAASLSYLCGDFAHMVTNEHARLQRCSKCITASPAAEETMVTICCEEVAVCYATVC